MNRLLRCLGLGVALALLVVAALAALLYAAVDEQEIRSKVAGIAEREFGVDLRIDGELALDLLPTPALSVADIRLRASKDATVDLASVKRLRLGVRLAPLLRRELRFDEATVDGLSVQAVREADGQTNWALAGATAGAASAAAIAAAPALEPSTPDTGLQFAIDRVRVTNGVLALEDRGAGTVQRLEIDALTSDGLNLQNVPFGMTGNGRLVTGSGEQQQTSAITLTTRIAVDRGAGRVALSDAQLHAQSATGEALALEAGDITSERGGALSLHRASLRKGALALEQIEARLRIDPAHTILESLTATLHGGTLDASGRFDADGGGALALDARLAGTDLRALLQALGQPPRAEGKLDATLGLKAQGDGPAQWKTTLAGPVALSLRDPVLHEISVEQLICKAAATLNKESLTATFEPLTRFGGLEAALDFRDGVGEFRTLAATLPSMALTGAGRVDLPQRKLKVHVDARITRDLADLDPACRMTRKMLAVEWPITCRGSFDEAPKQWCRIDSDDLAKIAGQVASEKLGDKIKDKLRAFFGNDG